MFKRKKTNRRFDRERVLDVKLRSKQVRVVRMRRLGLFLTATFAVLFVALLVWRGGEWLLNRFIYENDAFAIQKIEVQTDGLIAIEHLQRWAMVKPGDNLLALDLARVKRDLEMVPAIKSAAVERILPDRLRIRVAERDAIAQVLTMRLRPDGQYEHGVFHLDETGHVMLPLDPRLRSSAPSFPCELLPIISGIDVGELRPGQRIDSVQVQAALQLVGQFDYSPMFGVVDVQRIDVGTPDVLLAYTEQGSHVTFSLDDFDTQLRRWRIVHEHFSSLGRVVTTLDLSISNNIPVRWSDAGSVTPKQTKPSRNRKRNV